MDDPTDDELRWCDPQPGGDDMSKPVKPGWWWKDNHSYPVEVYAHESGVLKYLGCHDHDVDPEDGRWLCEIPTPEQHAALRGAARALKCEQEDGGDLCPADYDSTEDLWCDPCKALAALKDAGVEL